MQDIILEISNFYNRIASHGPVLPGSLLTIQLDVHTTCYSLSLLALLQLNEWECPVTGLQNVTGVSR